MITCTRLRNVNHCVVLYVNAVIIDDCILTNEWPLRVFRFKDKLTALASRFPNLYLNVIAFGRKADQLDITDAKQTSLTKEISELKPI